jgi:hypothetical protein
MIQSLDEGVGTVLDALKENGLEEDTLVFFLGDNGSVGKGHSGKMISNSSPLRGQKGQMFEGGVRVPFMARWPGHITPGAVDRKTVVTSTDLYATVLQAAGVKPRPEQARDSVNLIPVLTGTGPLDREAVYFHYPEGHTYLSPTRESFYAPGSSVRVGDWKLIRFYETSVHHYPNQFELYNLAEDISESRNLADEYPEKVQALNAMLDAYFKDTQALLPKPNPAYDPQYDSLHQPLPQATTLKTVTTSASSELTSANAAGKAVDGIGADDIQNFWATANGQDVGSWWQADFRKEIDLPAIRITFRELGKRYNFVPASITFQVSNDGKNWTTVIEKSKDVPPNTGAVTGKVYDYALNTKGCYLRLLFEDGTDRAIAGYKVVQLVEVQVVDND